jgi:hypothetical protein
VFFVNAIQSQFQLESCLCHTAQKKSRKSDERGTFFVVDAFERINRKHAFMLGHSVSDDEEDRRVGNVAVIGSSTPMLSYLVDPFASMEHRNLLAINRSDSIKLSPFRLLHHHMEIIDFNQP